MKRTVGRLKFVALLATSLCWFRGIALALNLEALAAFGINGDMTKSRADTLLLSHGFISTSKRFPSIGNGEQIEYRRGKSLVVLITSNQAILEISSSQVDIGRCRISSGETERQLTNKLGKPDRIERGKDDFQTFIYEDQEACRAVDVKLKNGRVVCVIFGGT